MHERESATHCLVEARRHDPDRFLCALFTPEPARSAVMALLAINQELGRVAEQTSQPLTGLIRLQWWREAIDEIVAGRVRAHPVVRELAFLIEAGLLSPDALTELVDAREEEIEGLDPVDLDAFEARARGSAGKLQRLCAVGTGMTDTDRLAQIEDIGTAWGMLGLVRATSHIARRGRCVLPWRELDMAGSSSAAVISRRMAPGIAVVVRRIVERATALLTVPPVTRKNVTALLRLPAVDYARAITHLGHDPFRAADLSRRPLLAVRLAVARLLP